ncbi:MAG TPA: Fe-Mn family superoxide dismutase [Planctomycetota bacterium]|nr:Fe-Mn family superoxide dismutase [Planctomycetota bacterium]
MPHEARNFDHLLGKGILSDNQLKQHFTLYQGYVKKINEIEEKLGKTDNSAANYSFNEYSELKRREPVAFNGSYLHELYFENLTQGGSAPSDAFKKAASDSFGGSWDNFIKDARMAGTSTPGWVLVTRSRVDNKIHNYVAYEHHLNIPVHQDIVMALDCWEHAFMIDFGIKKADYFDAFFKACDWKTVSARFDKFSKYTR